MKIALLHLDVAEGPETRNRRSIISAAGEAVSRGADWIVTPETALQGYFFYNNNGKLPSFSEKQLSRYLFFAGRNKADMFLSAAEYDERDGKGYNSCFVINREGKLLGKHRKMCSHRKGFERWLSLGRETHVFNIGTLHVGLLVCADSYYEQPCLEIKKEESGYGTCYSSLAAGEMLLRSCVCLGNLFKIMRCSSHCLQPDGIS